MTIPPTSPVAILEAKDRLSFSEAARLCGVSLPCIFRWRTRGRLLPDGSRVYLPAVTVGRRSYMRKSDLDAFLATVEAGFVRLPGTQKARSNQVPKETERYLEEVGIRQGGRSA